MRFPWLLGLLVPALVVPARPALAHNPRAAARRVAPAHKTSKPRVAKSAMPSTLPRRARLLPGRSLVSARGNYRLVLQRDGNVVLLRGGRPLWSTNTQNHRPRALSLQSDGNLVLTGTKGAVLWASMTQHNAATRLVLQSDGNLVLRSAGNRSVWNTDAVRDARARADARVGQAIGWFQAHAGSSSYEGRCELAVENAYGTASRYSTARANWMSGATAQHANVSSAPRGALVFWSTSAAGHVAISVGDGTVLSSSANGRIGRVPATFFQNPLGWKPVPF